MPKKDKKTKSFEDLSEAERRQIAKESGEIPRDRSSRDSYSEGS